MGPCKHELGKRVRKPADPGAGSGGSWASARLQAIQVRDDDGSRPAPVTPDEFGKFVAFANSAYRSCGIRFEYDPDKDFATLDSTLLNDIVDGKESGWPARLSRGKAAAAEHPGKVTVIVRHGPGAAAWGNNFAGTNEEFVVMGGYGAGWHCGHPHEEALAHELGHLLGLGHTFPGDPVDDEAQALGLFRKKGGHKEAFDGDGLPDTPADLAIRSLECEHRAVLTLDGVEFLLPRNNLMAYYDEADSLTPMQCRKAAAFLSLRLGAGAASPEQRAQRDGGTAFKAEALAVIGHKGCSEHSQDMAGFGKGLWRGDSQLFVNCLPDGSLTMQVAGLHPGRYRLVLFPTLAPDFARIRVAVDHQPIGSYIDLYGPDVLPAGRTVVGEFQQFSERAEVEFRVAGRNPEARGDRNSNFWGLDSLLFEAVGR